MRREWRAVHGKISERLPQRAGDKGAMRRDEAVRLVPDFRHRVRGDIELEEEGRFPVLDIERSAIGGRIKPVA
jgi:hypothetical protein